MKNVSDEVLRQIGNHRDWTKRYGVITNLVKNPRTPLAISLGMVSRLNPRDIKSIAVDRNVPEAIRKQAQKFVKGAAGRRRASTDRPWPTTTRSSASPRTATAAEVRQAYAAPRPRAAPRPLRGPRGEGTRPEFFQDLTTAFNTLSNEKQPPGVRRASCERPKPVTPAEIAQDAYARGLQRSRTGEPRRGGRRSCTPPSTTRPSEARYQPPSAGPWLASAPGRRPPAKPSRPSSGRSSSRPRTRGLSTPSSRALARSKQGPRSCARRRRPEAGPRGLDSRGPAGRAGLAARASACGFDAQDHPMKITYQAVTDVGRKRKGNEDSLFVNPEQQPLRGRRRHGRPRGGRGRLARSRSTPSTSSCASRAATRRSPGPSGSTRPSPTTATG